MKTKILMTYHSDTVRKPILSQAIKRHDVELNILKANINAQMNGRIFAEIEGSSIEISKFMDFMTSHAIHTDIKQSLMEIDYEKCTGCSACSNVCPTQALSINSENGKLNFEPYKCVSCDRCSPVCPQSAICEA